MLFALRGIAKKDHVGVPGPQSYKLFDGERKRR